MRSRADRLLRVGVGVWAIVVGGGYETGVAAGGEARDVLLPDVVEVSCWFVCVLLFWLVAVWVMLMVTGGVEDLSLSLESVTKARKATSALTAVPMAVTFAQK